MPTLAITAVLGLLDLANKVRETAIQKKEWSEEAEQAYKDRVKQSISEPHWKLSGRTPDPEPPTDQPQQQA